MSFVSTENYVVTIKFTEVRNNKGNFVIGIFKDNDSFQKEVPYKRIVVSKSNVSNKTMSTQVTLPKGTYGFSILDDENKNNEMNFNFFGIPEEGYGFADFYHTGFSHPNFDEFKIPISSNKAVTVKMKYF